jgi:uncharacterized protein (DUF4213/DUF364 family)
LKTDTLEGILQQRKPDAQVVVMGPPSSGLPDEIFRRGVDMIGGVMLPEPDRVLDLITEKGSGHHFFEKKTYRIVSKPLLCEVAIAGTEDDFYATKLAK